MKYKIGDVFYNSQHDRLLVLATEPEPGDFWEWFEVTIVTDDNREQALDLCDLFGPFMFKVGAL